MKTNQKVVNIIMIFFVLSLSFYYISQNDILEVREASEVEKVSYNLEDIPEYHGDKYVVINDNKPEFSEEEYHSNVLEKYSDLDSLGRCGVAQAKVGPETLPIEKRGSIGSIKPTGWHTIKYDMINGKYLYNRCHLIGYQLTGENANPKNLITCTRSMNADTMLEFENKVADYVEETNHHVLYRVTPIFEGNDLLARGVQMEAKSIEDDQIEFNVFVYNVQDGIEINYQNGESKLISNENTGN